MRQFRKGWVLLVVAWALACSTTKEPESMATDLDTSTDGENDSTRGSSTSAGSASSVATSTGVALSTSAVPSTGAASAGSTAVVTEGDSSEDGSVTDVPTATSSSSSASSSSESAPTDQTSNDSAVDATETSATDTQPTSTASDDSNESGEDGDLVAPRPLDVTAMAARHEHRFRALAADPEVSFNDNDQIAIFDNRAETLMGKLVLTFGGAGERKGNLTGGGEFCAKRGFHVLAVAAFQEYNIVDSGPDFFGNARRTVFEGVMYTDKDAFATVELTPADGVARRTQKALAYLHAMYPDEDWGYFLQADGEVRWSDVIFTGVSHGASNSARFASLVRASRVVAVAGPRDNLCQRIDLNDCGGEVATWLSEVPKTPMDRYFTFTGVQDDQHLQHLFAMEKLGYVGEPTSIDDTQPPYDGSHRLTHKGGHDDVCANQAYQDACNYAFGVPPENHGGVGP